MKVLHVYVSEDQYKSLKDKCRVESMSSYVRRILFADTDGPGNRTVPYPDVPTSGDGEPYYAGDPMPTRVADIAEVTPAKLIVDERKEKFKQLRDKFDTKGVMPHVPDDSRRRVEVEAGEHRAAESTSALKPKSTKPHQWTYGHAACYEVELGHKDHKECCYCKARGK